MHTPSFPMSHETSKEGQRVFVALLTPSPYQNTTLSRGPLFLGKKSTVETHEI